MNPEKQLLEAKILVLEEQIKNIDHKIDLLNEQKGNLSLVITKKKYRISQIEKDELNEDDSNKASSEEQKTSKLEV